MDPISQGALGAALPQSVSDRQTFRAKAVTITWVGCLAGMAPDLDVFIRSSTDPLLFLEYHRQFTHSLFFIPLGALICTLAICRFSRPTLNFKQTFMVCLLGYSTHALLDTCTTYGTQLLWPFTDQRFAWNTIAVVDPLATLPLLGFVLLALRRSNPVFARIGFVYFLCYLILGWIQSERAESAATVLTQQRGHQSADVSIKPGFANILLWKSVYIFEGRYYVDAVRVGMDVKIYTGTSIEKLDVSRDLAWLDSNSQQAMDVERFRWFSNDHLALDPTRDNFVIDMRYSILPNEIKSLWGISLSPNAGPTEHVSFDADRDATPARMAIFWAMLRGDTCIRASGNRDSKQTNCALEI